MRRGERRRQSLFVVCTHEEEEEEAVPKKCSRISITRDWCCMINIHSVAELRRCAHLCL